MGFSLTLGAGVDGNASYDSLFENAAEKLIVVSSQYQLFFVCFSHYPVLCIFLIGSDQHIYYLSLG